MPVVTALTAQMSKTNGEDQDPNDIEDFVAFSTKSLEGFAPFLMEEPQRVFLDSRVFNHWHISKRRLRLIRQMLVSRLLVVKRKRQVRKSGRHTQSLREEFR